MYKIMFTFFFFFKWSLNNSILCCGLITKHPCFSNNFIYEHTLCVPHKLSFGCCSSEPKKKSCLKEKLKVTPTGDLSYFSQCGFAIYLDCALLVNWLYEEVA